jgi:hypothetical protein
LIAAATAAGSFHYVTQAEGIPLLQHSPPLIEVNTNMVQDGKAAARTTAAGASMVGQTAAETPAAPQFAIIKGAILPPSKRGVGLRGGAPKQYPFDTMQVGDSFFVAVSEKHPNPVKTLGSTVSSANMRFAEKTGEMKEVTRAVRGDDRKAKTDAAGNKITETVNIPVYKHTRKFVIRAVEAGTKYGEFVASENGALIARVE